MAPGQRSFMPWPYVEGLTMAEATNELAFIATGAYGKPLAKVQGAPIRLATPWKYGFKSTIDRARLVRRQAAGDLLGGARARRIRLLGQRQSGRPASALEPGQETFLNDGQKRPTLIYNGYGEQVASLYKGLAKEPLFM